jgi:hypothetical protein
MIVGFCTSCMNRRWQLEQTLPVNLELLRGTPHFLAVVDYNSGDDLGPLLRAQDHHRSAGRLLSFRTDEPTSFHMSQAKNTAHRLALRRQPDILFNLDADNVLHRDTMTAIADLFSRKRDVYLHNWSGRWGDGTMGRIAMRAEDWVRLGGYDEAFLPMSWQDADLMTRCRAAGLDYVHDGSGSGRAVANTIEQKLNAVRLPDGARDLSPHRALADFTRANFMLSLRRPIRLRMQDHRRFRGRLDFEDGEVEV